MQSKPEHPDDEWFLISTLRGELGNLVARGADPARKLGEDGFQQVLRVPYPADARKSLVDALVEKAVRTRRVEHASLINRGTTLHSVADPVLNWRGDVRAVWLWVGRSKTPTYPHVLTGTWEWDLDSWMVVYGPIVPQIYAQDWVVGERYPIHETLSTSPDAEKNETARFLHARIDGSRRRLNHDIKRPTLNDPTGGVSGHICAATEIVRTADGSRWRGVTWDVTAYAPPQDTPENAAYNALVRDAPGWTATVYWDSSWPNFPIQIAMWHGGKVLDGIWVDPETGKARTHPDDRGLVRRWAKALEADTSRIIKKIRLWGTDSGWHTLELDISRLQGTLPPAATVRVKTDTVDGQDRRPIT